jgi:hypothetical protein
MLLKKEISDIPHAKKEKNEINTTFLLFERVYLGAESAGKFAGFLRYLPTKYLI